MNTLITGVSGAGKTSIAAELIHRGYHAINMDKVDGLCAWVDLATGLPAESTFKRESVDDWKDKYDWQWSPQKLRDSLDITSDAFYCGSSGNQKEFYHLFGKVFLLEMDEQLIRHRIFDLERDHDYGRRPGEIEEILSYYRQEQDSAKAIGAIVIDAHMPLEEIVDQILAETIAQ